MPQLGAQHRKLLQQSHEGRIERHHGVTIVRNTLEQLPRIIAKVDEGVIAKIRTSPPRACPPPRAGPGAPGRGGGGRPAGSPAVSVSTEVSPVTPRYTETTWNSDVAFAAWLLPTGSIAEVSNDGDSVYVCANAATIHARVATGSSSDAIRATSACSQKYVVVAPSRGPPVRNTGPSLLTPVFRM